MSYNSGDIVGYKNKLEEFRAYIFDLKGKVLIAHHGDCDGMVGGGLLAAFINQNLPAVTQVTYASSAEFRKQDFDYFSQFTEDCDFGIFVEGQGMTQDYAVLNEKFINIDHHPHPEDTPIKRMLNPRNFAIQPNPAISYVMYELFSEHLPPEASWIAALGSIVDYCPLPAEKIIAAHTKELEEADALRDTFLACQYVLPLTCQLAEFIATMPTPQALLAAEPYASRRVIYQNKIKEAISGAAISQDTVVAKTTVGEYRISSPLANRLQDIYNDRCVIVVEESDEGARFSVRNRRGNINIGDLLKVAAIELGEGDGSGHERAGSARVPTNLADAYIEKIEIMLKERWENASG